MAVLKIGEALAFSQLAFSPSELPELIRDWTTENDATPAIETAAEALIATEFDRDLLKDFVRRVCIWGGYAGIYGRVLGPQNPVDVTRAHMMLAHRHAVNGDLAAAIGAMVEINGLGISFASKHLRFLMPNAAVVLDSIISQRLGYPLSPAGYVSLIADFRAVRDHVEEAGVKNPVRADGAWRICDIEAAVFMRLRPSGEGQT
jgi:hypothetical protein